MCVIKSKKIFYSHNLSERFITLIQLELEPTYMSHLLVNLTTVYFCFCVHLVRVTKLKEVFACHGFAVHTNEQHVRRNTAVMENLLEQLLHINQFFVFPFPYKMYGSIIVMCCFFKSGCTLLTSTLIFI